MGAVADAVAAVEDAIDEGVIDSCCFGNRLPKEKNENLGLRTLAWLPAATERLVGIVGFELGDSVIKKKREWEMWG